MGIERGIVIEMDEQMVCRSTDISTHFMSRAAANPFETIESRRRSRANG
jgi:hypothetical protein